MQLEHFQRPKKRGGQDMQSPTLLQREQDGSLLPFLKRGGAGKGSGSSATAVRRRWKGQTREVQGVLG